MTRTFALLCSTLLALAAPLEPPVGAQPATPVQSRAQMILFAQSFDGAQTRSLNRTAGVAEARLGEARWMLVNYGGGSVVERGNGTIAGANVANDSGVELALAFDPESALLSGDAFMADKLNRHVRPLVDRVPARASAWTLRFTPAELGLGGSASGAIIVRFTRRGISHAGRDLVLVEYRLPGFALTSNGSSIAQWGQGGALVDPATGALLWSGSTHRAVAQQNGAARPYRAQFGSIAVDDAGNPLADPRAITELAPLLTQIEGKEASAPLPFAGEGAGQVSQLPLHLAAMIDLVAISAAQNGIDAHSAAFGGFVLGRTGSNRATVPAAAPTGDSQ